MQWTPTGINVPDYPKLAQLWWQNIGDAVDPAAKTPQAGDGRARPRPRTPCSNVSRKPACRRSCGPKLNKKETAEYWFAKSARTATSRRSEARQREAEGRDHRLRHADQVVAGHPAEAGGAEVTA